MGLARSVRPRWRWTCWPPTTAAAAYPQAQVETVTRENFVDFIGWPMAAAATILS